MKKTAFLVTITVLLLSSCRFFTDDQAVLEKNIRVTEIEFSEATYTVNLGNLSNNNIVLVKVNTSTNELNSADTGGAVVAPSPAPDIGNQRDYQGTPYIPELIMGHPEATRFQANPPPVPRNTEILRRSTSLADFNTVGSKHSFWL